MGYPVLLPQNTWFKSQTKTRPDFTAIRIVSSYTPTGAETENWNADVGDTGAIKCYVVGTELIIAGNGGMIAANPDSSYLFSADIPSSTFTKFEDIVSFRNVTHIYGAELLDMRAVTTLLRAFQYDLELEYINTSKWEFKVLDSLEYTFGAPTTAKGVTVGGMKIKNLAVSGWKVGTVRSFKNTFLNNQEIEMLDTIDWNMESAETINSMCRGCTKLKTIHTENWYTPNLTDITYSFANCSSLEELNFGKLNNHLVTAAKMNAALVGLTNLKKMTIGTNYTFSGIYGRPTDPEGVVRTWHTMHGDSFTTENLPSGINITYYSTAEAAQEDLAKLKLSFVLVDGYTAVGVADAIREKTGAYGDLKPSEWAAAIRGI